jgi:hypothetical protein
VITGNGFSKSSRRVASLTSIAAAADVSVSTVSKVLNGRSDVAGDPRAARPDLAVARLQFTLMSTWNGVACAAVHRE